MRKTILAVALAGIALSVAIAVRSDLSEDIVPPPPPASAPAPAATPSVVEPSTPIQPASPAIAPPSTGAISPNVNTPASPAPMPVADEQATGASVLRAASTAYSRVKSLQANFIQKRDNPLLGSTTTSRGTLYQKRPDRFLMKFSDPAGDVIVSDGKYFWLYYPSADRKQVLRADATDNAAGGVDLQAQFLGDPLRRFTHTYHGTEAVGGRTAHELTLVPRQNLGYKSLKIWVDAKDSMVRRFILSENNGLVQQFTLSNLTINPALSNNLFRFTPPADAHIVERP